MAHTPKHARKQAKKAAKQERRSERRAAKLGRRRAGGDISFKDALRIIAPQLLDRFDLGTEREEDIFKQIEPLAQMFINFALDPVSFLNSPQGQAILAPLQEATARNFEGARQNFFNQQGATGFSPQSGVSAGPLAAFGTAEANAQTGNISNLIGQALGFGVPGAQLLAQQQERFGPLNTIAALNQSAATRFSAPPPLGQQLGLAALGAGGTALSGFIPGGSGPLSSQVNDPAGA